MALIPRSLAPTLLVQHQPRLQATRLVLRLMFGPAKSRAIRTRLWDGSEEGPADARLTLVLERAGALRRMLPPSDLSVAEGHLYGDYDLEGDVEVLMAQGAAMAARLFQPKTALQLLPLLLALPAHDHPPRPNDVSPLQGEAHSRDRDAQAIQAHYDIGNAFYALWLDERMVYSCAYFSTGQKTLGKAQRIKLDRICRKLRLKPGEQLLDIGSGWGGLAIYAAQNYGVQVTGITLSPAQLEVARTRAEAAGVADRVTFERRDYRELPPHQPFDQMSSVGMVEHVGRARLPGYIAEAYRMLRPGGLFLNHGIVPAVTPPFFGVGTRLIEGYLSRHSFLQEYVFPDGELRPLNELLGYAERVGFKIRDVENRREHYALTLREWVRRLERQHDEVVRLTDEVTYRIWRLYMAGSADSFAAGRIGVVQTLLARPTDNGNASLPLNRLDVELTSGQPTSAKAGPAA